MHSAGIELVRLIRFLLVFQVSKTVIKQRDKDLPFGIV